jgi:hypothetical protein
MPSLPGIPPARGRVRLQAGGEVFPARRFRVFYIPYFVFVANSRPSRNARRGFLPLGKLPWDKTPATVI